MMLLYAKHGWISLIDVDDIWETNKLEVQMKYTDDYDVIGTRAIYFGERGGFPNIPTHDITNLNFFVYSNPIINSSAIIRRKLCYWNPEYEGGVEDFELWLRLQSKKKRFFNCEEFSVRHRIHSTSAFNTKDHSSRIQKLADVYNSKMV
jgi:hypothetical protein